MPSFLLLNLSGLPLGAWRNSASRVLIPLGKERMRDCPTNPSTNARDAFPHRPTFPPHPPRPVKRNANYQTLSGGVEPCLLDLGPIVHRLRRNPRRVREIEISPDRWDLSVSSARREGFGGKKKGFSLFALRAGAPVRYEAVPSASFLISSAISRLKVASARLWAATRAS
jgi:hypothetical protein